MNDVPARVRSFVVDNFLFGEESDTLTPGTSFIDSGIIDSTGVLELVAYLEEEFGIQIEDQEMTLANLDSMERVGAFVARKTASSGS